MSGLGKPVSVRDLVRELSLDAPARRELKSVLRQLIGAGALVKIRGARVGLPDRMNLVVGRLSCSPAGHGFVVPEKRRPGQVDLFVAASNIREAYRVLKPGGVICMQTGVVDFARGLAGCTWGGFCDSAVAKYVGADGTREIAVLGFVLGKRTATGIATK